MIELKTVTIEGFHSTEFKITDVSQRGKYDDNKDFIINDSPHGNCQMFTVGYMDEIMSYKKPDVKVLLKEVCKRVSKRLMLLDIREDQSKEILKRLRPFSNKISIKRYLNTNGSKMMIVIVHLDRPKIFS